MSGALLTGGASIGISNDADFRRFLPIIQHGVPACLSRGAPRVATSSYVHGLFFGYCCFCGRPIRATPRIKDMRGFGLPRLKLNPPKPCVLCIHNLYHLPRFVVPDAKRPLFTWFLGPPQNKLMFAAFCEACAQNIFVNSCVFGLQSLPVFKAEKQKTQKMHFEGNCLFFCAWPMAMFRQNGRHVSAMFIATPPDFYLFLR